MLIYSIVFSLHISTKPIEISMSFLQALAMLGGDVRIPVTQGFLGASNGCKLISKPQIITFLIFSHKLKC